MGVSLSGSSALMSTSTGDKKFCVYRVRHIETDVTIYIGKTARPRKRWINHCNGKRKGERLRSYMLEHGGLDAYELVPLQWFPNEAQSYRVERETIEVYLKTSPLLNLSTGGFGGSPNRMSEVHRERLSRLSPKERAALTKKANEAVRGIPRPPQVRACISEAHLRWWQEHPEARERVGAWRRGQKHTSETKQRLGEKRRSLTNEQTLRCRQLQAEGLPLKRIGELLGVGIKAVFNAVHGNGIYATVS